MSQKAQTVRTERRPPTRPPTGRSQHDTELVDNMGELLDQIDGVLEDNALEVMRAYVQRSGE